MAENTTTYLRSFSDSEVNERNSKQSDLEQQRTERYSGSKTPAIVESSMDYNNPNISLVDYEIFDDAISSLENITDRTMNVERNFPEAFESCHKRNIDTDIQIIKQELNKEENRDEEEIRAPESSESSSLRSTTAEMASDENRQTVPDIFKTPMSSNDSLRQEIQTSLPKEESSIRNKQSSGNRVHVENSILFPILEVPPKENFLVPSEDFIGEPRCLALKKYATDDDMDDALELNFAEFDDDDESINEQPPKPKSSTKNVQKKNSNDMFLDDDDPVEVRDFKNTNYIDLANPKNNWERPVVEKEEGELTPDLYSTTLSDGGESKNTRPNKHSIQTTKESNQTRDKQPERKESNQDFFLKINRCFRQLEREFCNMHVPRGSRRMIGQLQNTLCNVDRMKRRLTFLIDSAKNVSSDKSKNTSSNSKDDKHSSSRRGSFDDGKSKSSKTECGRSERSTSLLLRDTIRSQKEAEARMNRHIRRTAASIAYAGTKQEKQRIQSLFKRQMNLINQHVIQKNDSGKNQNLKAGGSRTKKESEKTPDVPKVPELKTLDEMEAFLAVLKVQKSQKEEILAKENQKKQQGPLRFTTKTGQPVANRRAQPVLLVGANPPQNQIGDVAEETEWEKKVEILKAMSDKRKEILKNKKDYEEVMLLQEQLQKLTNMDVPAEASKVSLNSTKFRMPKEQNVPKSVAKDGKETSTKEIELKKRDTSFRGEITDSISVKRDQKEMECIKATFHPRSSDCEVESHEITPENSKRRKKRKVVEEEENFSSETSKSDKELKNRILKKRKRTESGGKLSVHKKYTESDRRSLRSRHRSNTEEASIIDGFDEKLPEELMSKKLVIVGDKNMELLNERFCLKVKGNQIYLKKVGRIKRAGKVRREQRRESNQSDRKIRSGGERNRTIDDGVEKAGTKHSLKEMEDFLQQLRAKKKVRSEERDYIPKSNQQSREMKFMARIQAKRKAKLMACVSTATPDITEKEAKFLKDLENQARDPCDSPDTEKRKQKLMQTIREETDAIVLQQKQVEDDPLSDVKTFLNMIKEAESGNDEKSKQFCVSFSMKRSEVKQLENIASGKASALTEESQKFLNSVRAKMRAKKTPVAIVGDHHGQKG